MGLKDIKIKKEYRIPRDDIISEFYIPLLKKSNGYDRSVGYFSSDSLIELSYGIAEFVKNGGKIRLIVSPNLSKEDYDAINRGYEEREKIIENSLMNCLFEYDDYFKRERLNLISELIAREILDIKIAFSVIDGKLGLYHEKMGLLYDCELNMVAFSGSMNETINGMTKNYETIDVFTSWNDKERVLNKKNAFKKLWSNVDRCAKTFEFPEVVKRKILNYNYKKANYEIDKEEQQKIIEEYEERKKRIPCIPKNIEMREYQIEAVNNWKDNNYIGIFDMATGTGKTITAISAIINLLENNSMNVGIVICVPYQHLVDQWYEDLIEFHFKPIMGYSASPQKQWKKRLRKELFEYSNCLRDNFCFILTNDTFSSKYIQDLIRGCKKNIALIVDEAHNFGSKKLLSLLDKEKYLYRLGLSATFERYNDEVGTRYLFDFFGKKCIEYTMKQAIDEGMLTKYYYHPITIYLDPDELETYNQLSIQIKKALKFNEDESYELTEIAKTLLIKRSRIIAGARNKIYKLKELMESYKDRKHMLIYCGATKYYDISYSENEEHDNEEIKQITKVQQILNNELNMTVLQFTSNESAEERKLIIDDFKSGRNCQAIVAIKCLDEGVNIPNIQTAFILASSTNPKEYIQRRGRVLRKAKGKDFSVIYDFITLPRDINNIQNTDDMDYDLSLVRREITRMKEFADLSMNSRDTYSLIDKLYNIYGKVVYENERSIL